MTELSNLLQETRKAFADIRGSVVVAMQKLHEVYESKAWEGVASSWSEFVESDLGISQGFASKLLSVNKHYVLEGGYSHANIANIDVEKLYLAAKSGGTPAEQIEKAKTLNRSELRQEREETKDHEHEYIEICKHCSMRKHD